MTTALTQSAATLLGLFLSVAPAGCSTPAAWPARDWSVAPAVLQADFPATASLYAISDPHGAYDRLVTLLSASHLIAPAPATPSAVSWTAGSATLVVTGDLIDHGVDAVDVIDLLRALEVSAQAAGGKVIVTLGNHEAEFLVDPQNRKATATDGINVQLGNLGIQPQDVALGVEPRGMWLRQRPLAARVGRWFFSHAGDTGGRSLAQLSSDFTATVDHNNYNDQFLIGSTSILESQGWYSADGTIGQRYATAVGAAHLVFGHDPGALGTKGAIGIGQGGTLFRIDCGMSPNINYSPGAVFQVVQQGAQEIVNSITPDGVVTSIWRGFLP